MFHTEFTERLIDGLLEPPDHKVHGEDPGISPRSLCAISVTSVRNAFTSLHRS